MNLSRYVSSTNQAFDDLTVTVNEADFTNVEGGLGIFGAYVNKIYDNIQFQENYIESFGYNFISTN
jgi:virulence-associated protein VapD